MNMKLMTGLAVVIALASAMTFVKLYASGSVESADSASTPAAAQVPSGTASSTAPSGTNPTSSVRTSATVGGQPVETTVTISE